MTNYTAIVSTENGRITKFAEFETQQEAQNHVSVYGGFVYNGPYQEYLEVGFDNTVTFNQGWADEAMAANVRMERDMVLASEVDPIVTNPLRWADMTTTEQNAWSQYRTDLLNITDQAGFPNDVTWPTKPE